MSIIRHSVTFKWVKGHSGIEGNERADALSQHGAMEACGHEIDIGEFDYGRRAYRSADEVERELDRQIPWERMEA